MLFRCPDGMTAVSVSGVEFTVVNGLINAEGHPPEIHEGLVRYAKCVKLTAAEAAAVTTSTTAPPPVPSQIHKPRRFRAPPNVSSLSVAGRMFTPDENGLFIVDSCTDEMAHSLVAHAKCEALRMPPHSEEKKATKADVMKRMTEAGIPYDGRASLERLLELESEWEAEKKAEGQGTDVERAA